MFFVCGMCGFYVGMQTVSSGFLAGNQPSVEFCSKSQGSFVALNGSLKNYTVRRTSNVTVSNSSIEKYLQIGNKYKTTVLEEWNLICGRKWMVSLIQSTFMAGILFGAAIMSELADRYGRRPVVLSSVIFFFVFGNAVALSRNYLMFVVLRFIVAFFASGFYLTNFVFLMEVVGSESRVTMGILYQGFFALGLCAMAVVAYYVRYWRLLQLAISLPSALLFFYFCILPESPRWLVTQGQHDKAIECLEHIARNNKKFLPRPNEIKILAESPEKLEEKLPKTVCQYGMDLFRMQKTLFSTPNMRRRCLLMFFSWFVLSMVYYGLTFNGGNIRVSNYVMIFFGGVVELPAYFLIIPSLKLFGNRVNLTGTFICCGVICLCVLLVPRELAWVNLSLIVVGKFMVSAGFALVFIYAIELFPTPVRGAAVGYSSVSARIGAILAPFIVDLLGDVHYALPSSIFGGLALLAGLVDLLLPETSGLALPESVEEVEEMER